MNKKLIFPSLILTTLIPTGIILAQIQFKSPWGSVTFDEMLTRVLSWVWPFSLAVGVLMLIIGSYYLVLSGGDPQKAATGRKVITYALVGVAIVTVAKGIVVILETIFPSDIEAVAVIPAMIEWAFGFLLVIIVLMLIMAAYLFVTAVGNPEKITMAKRWITYALIGLAIAVTSRGLIALVGKMVGQDTTI